MLHRCLDVAYEQSRGIVRTWQSQGNQARCLMLELSGLSFGTCPEPNIGAHLFMLKPSYDGLHASECTTQSGMPIVRSRRIPHLARRRVKCYVAHLFGFVLTASELYRALRIGRR